MLAINTAFMTANLALKTPKGAVYLKDIDAKSKHSENVLKTIDELCQQAKINILDVETIAVVVGPGSFTGLRIGTAVAKALGCVNENLRFVAMSSLELMAYIVGKNSLAKGSFVCAINALSGLFFVCEFDKNGKKLTNEKMIDTSEFEKLSKPKFVLTGDLKGDGLNEIEITCADMLDFALLKEAAGEFVLEGQLEPVYLRLSQAEDNLSKNCKKNK